MSDQFSMWDEQTSQITDRRTAAQRSLAVAAVEPLWDFLAASTTQSEFEQRLALSDDSIARMVAQVIPEGSEVYREQATGSLRERFAALSRHRDTEKTAQALQQAVAAQIEASLPKAAGYAILTPDGKPLWGKVHDTEEEAHAHFEKVKGRKDDLVPKDISTYKVGPVKHKQAAEHKAPTDHEGQPEWGSSTAHDLCDVCGWPVAKGKDGKWAHEATNPVQWTDKRKKAKTESSMQKGAPFAGYEDFDACVAANSDKDDPEAYCGSIKHKVEDAKTGAYEADMRAEDVTLKKVRNPNMTIAGQVGDFAPVHEAWEIHTAAGVGGSFGSPSGLYVVRAKQGTTIIDFEGQQYTSWYGGFDPKDVARLYLVDGYAKQMDQRGQHSSSLDRLFVEAVEMTDPEHDRIQRAEDEATRRKKQIEDDEYRRRQELAGGEFSLATPRNKLSAAEDRKGHTKTCPKCGTQMASVVQYGDTMYATCDSCGWKGSKTRSKSPVKTGSDTIGVGDRVYRSGGRSPLVYEVEAVNGDKARCVDSNGGKTSIALDRLTKVKSKTSKTAAGPIAWQGDYHFGVGYLKGRARNGDNYEVYSNPNNGRETPYHWVNYGPEFDGDTAPLNGPNKGRSGQFATMIDAVRDAEQDAVGAKTSGLKDLDDGALDKEHRRVMEQQNNTRKPEAQQSLRDWRRQIEQEKAERSKRKSSRLALADLTLDGVRFRLDKGDMIGWMDDWGAPYDKGWLEAGLVESVPHNSGGLGGASYRLTEQGRQKTSAVTMAAAEWDMFGSETDDEGQTSLTITDPSGEKHYLDQETAGHLLDSLNGHAAPTPLSNRFSAKTAVDGLPSHLQEYWGTMAVDPRNSPAFCAKQSHKTPVIPWHNGDPCLSCGKSRAEWFKPKTSNRTSTCANCGGQIEQTGHFDSETWEHTTMDQGWCSHPEPSGFLGSRSAVAALLHEAAEEPSQVTAMMIARSYRVHESDVYACYDGRNSEASSLARRLRIQPEDVRGIWRALGINKDSSVHEGANPNFRTPEGCLCPPPRGNDPRGDRRGQIHFEIRDDDHFYAGPFERRSGGPGSADYAMMNAGEWVGFGSTPDGPGLHIVRVDPGNPGGDHFHNWDPIFEQYKPARPASVEVVGRLSANDALRAMTEEEALEVEAAFFHGPQQPNRPLPGQRPADPGGASQMRQERDAEEATERRHEEYWDANPEEAIRHRQQQAPQRQAGAVDNVCYNCSPAGSGKDWRGLTCSDCGGSGKDTTPYGTGGDHCPYCGADWKAPHREECPRNQRWASRQAVNENAYGTDRYQKQPTVREPEWIHDAWGQDHKPTPMHARDRENPFSKDTLDRVERQRKEVKDAARRTADLEGLEQPDDFAPESAGSQPRTTRPRVMPQEHKPPQVLHYPQMEHAPDQFPDADIAGFANPTHPTTEQAVAAKVARLARRVTEDNPEVSEADARRLAAATVARYPEMVRR